MKKIVILLIALLLTSNIVKADYSTVYCTPAFDVSSKTNQVVSKIFGATFFGEKLAETIIRKQLKKETGERFKVSLKSYSLADLKKGIFRNLRISGRHLNFNGIYISSIEAKTLCDFNYFDFSTNEIYNRTNILMQYEIVVSQKDLQKTLLSETYLNAMKKVDLSALGIRLFKIDEIDVTVEDERLHFVLSVISPYVRANKMTFRISTALRVENGKIKSYDARLENSNKRINVSKYLSLLNVIDPLVFSMNKFSIPNGKFMIKNIKIVDDKVLVDGIIFIPKR